MASAFSAPARLSADRFAQRIGEYLRYSLGKKSGEHTPDDAFRAIALALRELLIEGMFQTEERYERAAAKKVYYLSMEFLIGRLLSSNLANLGVQELCREACARLGLDLDAALRAEPDAALGNGGLGRLAACFLESMATLGVAGYGYGLNYEFGLFRQEIHNGYQEEKPDQWLAEDSPWQLARPDLACRVPVYGHVEAGVDRLGNYNPMWMDWKLLVGVPHDIPIAGAGGRTVNFLRLYSARASSEFDMKIFNEGDYVRAVEQKIASETVSKVLYPSDEVSGGKELRLIQEYFLVACALRDIVSSYRRAGRDPDRLGSAIAIQMNDTHPALAVAELMRLLVDEASLPWEKAWEITHAVCGYTNHTLLPEALEKWPVDLFQRVLPRHLQLIYEINHRFLEDVRKLWPGDGDRERRLSLIEEGPSRQVRMAHLAIVGSHSVNGVAALHSRLVREQLVPDFYQLWPQRFNNKTNGVTHRRWLVDANPDLARLITGAIGDGWISDLSKLKKLEFHAGDAGFQQDFRAVKRANKERLAKLVHQAVGLELDPAALFDIQAKRMHEYKRQLLNVLHVIQLYLTITEDGVNLPCPRTVLFAGKAAPGYFMAKRIIKLIHNVARLVNADARTRGQLQVAFLPDYKVSLAEILIPAADLSEQISTAGKEASGTGNMKFAMNGALTVGTLDGANIEILEEVGRDNMYIFGLSSGEVESLSRDAGYDPAAHYHGNPLLRRVVDTLAGSALCPDEPGIFQPLFDHLLQWRDPYFILADFESYRQTQAAVSLDFARPGEWARRAILNVARMGRFSSDRTIREYAAEIWNVPVGN